jgi:copper chaperone
MNEFARIKSIVLNVPGISCAHCKTSIEGAVGELMGVDRVNVDIAGRSVAVDFDQVKTSLSAIVAAIDEVGYEVS